MIFISKQSWITWHKKCSPKVHLVTSVVFSPGRHVRQGCEVLPHEGIYTAQLPERGYHYTDQQGLNSDPRYVTLDPIITALVKIHVLAMVDTGQ